MPTSPQEYSSDAPHRSPADGVDPRVRRIRRHIASRFATAKLEKFPFPHMIIGDFFPDDVHAKILKFNLFKKNAGVDWITRPQANAMVTPTPYDHRKQINFHKDQDYEATDEERSFWKVITRTFLSGSWFPRLVQAKYPAYFDIRFGEAVQWSDFWDQMKKELFLHRHEPNYHIGPHTDIPTRIFTCIFAFSDRPGYEDFGTQLLRPTDRFVRCWGRQHYDTEGFEVVKTAPYAPNSFLLFFKTRQSFHAVKTVTPDVPNDRYGMQYQLYEPGTGLFRDLSHPDLLAPKLMKAEQR
ncbi:MAG: hypothetical protein HYY48_04885 [Gammaproteobacteria bacterium]|nr:hypothetical protein [Gammaproteobacteria bacterium]